MSGSRVVKILGGLALFAVVGFVLIQLIPVSRTNPPVVSEPNWDSPQTRALMERACFDCHSNETKWPAYAYVAPVSWLVARDVNEGRDKFNLSDWLNNPGEGKEMIETIQKGEMPMPIYLPLHPEARLTAAEQAQLIAGIEATFGGEGNERGEAGEHDERDEENE
ncbi:MAG: heme-binding domain-containing protein [Anaerolineae bacterium]